MRLISYALAILALSLSCNRKRISQDKATVIKIVSDVDISVKGKVLNTDRVCLYSFTFGKKYGYDSLYKVSTVYNYDTINLEIRPLDLPFLQKKNGKQGKVSPLLLGSNFDAMSIELDRYQGIDRSEIISMRQECSIDSSIQYSYLSIINELDHKYLSIIRQSKRSLIRIRVSCRSFVPDSSLLTLVMYTSR